MWFCKITWQTNYYYHHYHSAYGRQTLQIGDFLWGAPVDIVKSAFNPWSCEITWQTLYLYYHNTYGHQPWQGGDIPWGAPNHKVAWSFNHVVLWGHVTNLILYISTCTWPTTTKYGKVVTYWKRLPSPNSYDPKKGGLMRSRDKLNTLYLHLQKTYGH